MTGYMQGKGKGDTQENIYSFATDYFTMPKCYRVSHVPQWEVLPYMDYTGTLCATPQGF